MPALKVPVVVHRPPRRPYSTKSICSCEWRVDSEFLAAQLFPERCIVPIQPGADARWIIRKLPEDLTHFIFQLNCTNTARFIQSRHILLRHLETRGVIAINGRVVDISKRHLQRLCRANGLNSTLASEHGRSNEMLIVKTNWNAGGSIERRALSALNRQRLTIPEEGPVCREFREQFTSYPVLARAEIPREWWRDDQLIVERFVGNSDERFYRVHTLLNRFAVTDAICPGATKKLGVQVTRKVTTFHSADDLDAGLVPEPLESILGQVRRLQYLMDFEFAGVDIVVDNCGKPFVVDVNTTPFAGHMPAGHPIIEYLSQALVL